MKDLKQRVMNFVLDVLAIDKRRKMDVQLDDEQHGAVDKMRIGRNAFLTGKAGVGKSTTVREFVRGCDHSCVILAPTGVAALNAGGATIHSFFRFPPALLTQESIGSIRDRKKIELIRAVKTIVIDEISMVRSDVFCAMDFRLRELAKGVNRDIPFGGKQIIVVGDFFQLPPVVTDEKTQNILYKLYGGIYAFETDLWRRANFANIVLKKVHRQANDLQFVKLLNAIRNGDLTSGCITDEQGRRMNVCEAFAKFCPPSKRLDESVVRLCLRRKEARLINEKKRKALQGSEQDFIAAVEGSFKESDYPTESKVSLAEGARVMILVNKRYPDGTAVHVNGDMGTVTEFGKPGSTEEVKVRLDRTGKEVGIERFRWDKVDYELVKKADGTQFIDRRHVGSFTQIPLKLAYAITVHKAQGLSLDCVDLRLSKGCFTHGQLYTALSRCKSLKNLRIDRRIMQEDLMLDREVLDFYKSLDDPNPEVELRIPSEFEDEVRKLIEQLKAKQVAKSELRTLTLS